MTRQEELLKVFEKTGKDKLTVVKRLIDEMINLETQLDEIKKYPMLKVSSKNPELAKPTPMSKLYKELLQAYNVTVKNLDSMLRVEDTKEESPLRTYLRQINEK